MTRILSLIFVLLTSLACNGQSDTSICLEPDVAAVFNYKNCQNTSECIKKFVEANAEWPTQDDVNCIVYFECIIETDGSISDIKLLRGTFKKINEASLDLIKKMPNWIPAQKNGIEVRSKVYIPIRWQIY